MTGHKKAAGEGSPQAAYKNSTQSHFTTSAIEQQSSNATSDDFTNLPDALVTFTLIQSQGCLSKEYWIGTDNRIQKQAAANLTRGRATRVSIPFSQLSRVFEKATETDALCHGIHAMHLPDEAQVVDTQSLKQYPDAIARTKDNFAYPAGPGLLMIDHDPGEYVERMTPEELIKALSQIHPDIERAARIVRGSVSAGVHRPNEPPRDDKGFHVYIPVQNAVDIPRYCEVLFRRLWLQGHGRIALARNGALLVRSPIDAAVASPERLDFIAPPIIRMGATLVYTPPTINYREGGLLDTANLADLDDAERAEFEQLVSAAKEAIKPKAQAKRVAYVDEKVAERVTQGVPEEKARADVERMFTSECKDLDADFIVHFVNFGAVTVREILADPQRFDGQALADPIEGIEYGNTTAKFYWNNGKPVVNSFAHGGCQYFLHGDSDRGEGERGESGENPATAGGSDGRKKANPGENWANSPISRPIIRLMH